jgi:DNA polymerase
MSYVVLDFETYYDKEYSLRKMTPVEYLLDTRFEVIGCAVIDREGLQARLLDGKPVFVEPEPLRDYLAGLRQRQLQGEVLTVISHNALFDMCILAWKYGVVPDLIIDTLSMARATVYAYTGSAALDVVADYFSLPPKGTAIKHVSGMNAQAIKDAGLWDTYTAYAEHDAWLCEQIYQMLMNDWDFPEEELEIYDLVIKCAVVPKFQLDADLLAQHAAQLEAHKQALLARCGMTDRLALMSNEKFAAALGAIGLNIEIPMKLSPTTGELTYAFAKSDPAMIELSEHEDVRVQALVAARIGHKSTIEQTRTEKLLRIAQLEWPNGSRGWCPIPLRNAGAHTHRLSGDWKLNAQNWPRFTTYEGQEKQTGLLRRAHKAPPGKSVVKRDASQIEARIVAWLPRQLDLVQAFREGRDIYSEFAEQAIYHYPVNKTTVDERFVGKTAILGLGFGVGPDKFASEVAAKSYANLGHKIDMPVTQAGNIVNAYRTMYPMIPLAWKTLQNYIPVMARDLNFAMAFGPVILEHQSIFLPNGQRLYYHNLEYDTQKQEWMFKYGRMPKKIYGGKMFENIVQALARIITMSATLKMKKLFPKIGLAHQVHDDLVYIVPNDMVIEFDHALAQCMNEPPLWAAELPLASEGGIGPNYGDAK